MLNKCILWGLRVMLLMMASDCGQNGSLLMRKCQTKTMH